MPLPLTILLAVIGVALIALGLVGLLRPASYQTMMRRARSAGPIPGLRLISSLELAVGVVDVVIVAMLR